MWLYCPESNVQSSLNLSSASGTADLFGRCVLYYQLWLFKSAIFIRKNYEFDLLCMKSINIKC